MKQLLAAFVSATLAVAILSSAAAGPDTPTLVYSSYLGNVADEQGRSVALDAAGRAYVTGYTSSVAFPAAHAGRLARSWRGRLRGPLRP